MIKLLFCLLCILLMTPLSHGQNIGAKPMQPVQNQQEKPNSPAIEADSGESVKKASPKLGSSSAVGWLSSFEFWMSFSVLVFGLLVFAIEIIMVRLTKFQPEQTIKLLAVTLIVISTLFIITAGFDSEQIAPAMGLFGTVAGYMLGRASGKPGEVQE